MLSHLYTNNAPALVIAENIPVDVPKQLEELEYGDHRKTNPQAHLTAKIRHHFRPLQTVHCRGERIT